MIGSLVRLDNASLPAYLSTIRPTCFVLLISGCPRRGGPESLFSFRLQFLIVLVALTIILQAFCRSRSWQTSG
jgi:hypothetical protein